MFCLFLNQFIISLPSSDDFDISPAPSLFDGGEIGDRGEEEDPGESKAIPLPNDDKLFLLELLLRLSSLEVLSTERLTKGPSVLK